MDNGSPTALLVDFGGVLTTSVLESFDAFCRAEGLPEGTLARIFAGDPATDHILRAREEGQSDAAQFETEFAAALSEIAGRTVDPTELTSRMITGLRPDDRMAQAVQALRGYGITAVLVSNSLGKRPYGGYDLTGLFDEIVVSGDVGLRKPEPAIYALAAEKAGAAPQRCVMIDDFEHNVAGAQAIGMHAIHHRTADETIPQLEALFGVELA